MSEDASYELQRAIYARLVADAGLAGLVADRVYDDVPRQDGKITADFPYVSFGPETEIPEIYDCIDGAEITMQIDAWSRDPGFREVKRIAAAVEKALHDAPLTIAENALVYFVKDGRRVMRDPDGLTSHAVITFRAGVEKR
ncbi:MAG: DUF3168 domain-containing protein [Shinella sp.]|nr:DUF3168 domain-containing protein [Shinella sp.]